MEIGGRFSGRLLGNSGGIFVLLFRQCLNQPSHSALVPSHEIVTLPHTTPRYPESSANLRMMRDEASHRQSMRGTRFRR